MASTIKVDNIQNQPGTDIIKKCGSTVTVGAPGNNVTVAGNDVRSNDYKASDGGNIINQCGTTITLGASGDTINLASGASQSGFGRTGTVDWQTGSIKTATFTAANGEGYFANTSGGAFTMNLPAGSAGNIVSVVDYTNTFQTNALTVSPNGSEKIGGVAEGVDLVTEGQSVTFVYVDATEGWKNIQDSTSNVIGNAFISATVSGSCNTLAVAPCCANVKIATFKNPGTFCVSAIAPGAPDNVVSYLVIGGGGCGGGGSLPDGSSGGGAGGFREVNSPSSPYTASPLNGYPTPGNLITVSATAYPITVGGGGTGGGPGSSAPGVNGTTGSNSIFSTTTSAGGGAGHGHNNANSTPGNGGSGAGASGGTPRTGQTGNSPPTTPPQGNNGGAAGPGAGGSSGGGGGAGGVGVTGTPSGSGAGGDGIATSITGSPVTRAGGGGGAGAPPRGTPCGGAGPGGGGAGGPGGAGTVNTGSGAGGGACNTGGTGGSGIVVIRYKFQ